MDHTSYLVSVSESKNNLGQYLFCCSSKCLSNFAEAKDGNPDFANTLFIHVCVMAAGCTLCQAVHRLTTLVGYVIH